MDLDFIISAQTELDMDLIKLFWTSSHLSLQFRECRLLYCRFRSLEFLNSVGIVPCVCSNVEPMTSGASLLSLVSCHQSHGIFVTFFNRGSHCIAANGYPLHTALVIGLTRERFVALGLPSWTHLRTRYWGVFTLQGLKYLLGGFGLWCCESWRIGENEKVKHDSTAQRFFW